MAQVLAERAVRQNAHRGAADLDRSARVGAARHEDDARRDLLDGLEDEQGAARRRRRRLCGSGAITEKKEVRENAPSSPSR